MVKHSFYMSMDQKVISRVECKCQLVPCLSFKLRANIHILPLPLDKKYNPDNFPFSFGAGAIK